MVVQAGSEFLANGPVSLTFFLHWWTLPSFYHYWVHFILFFITLIYLFGEGTWGLQRGTYRSWFSPSIMRVSGIKSGHEPLPAEPSHSLFLLLKNITVKNGHSWSSTLLNIFSHLSLWKILFQEKNLTHVYIPYYCKTRQCPLHYQCRKVLIHHLFSNVYQLWGTAV